MRKKKCPPGQKEVDRDDVNGRFTSKKHVAEDPRETDRECRPTGKAVPKVKPVKTRTKAKAPTKTKSRPKKT